MSRAIRRAADAPAPARVAGAGPTAAATAQPRGAPRGVPPAARPAAPLAGPPPAPPSRIPSLLVVSTIETRSGAASPPPLVIPRNESGPADIRVRSTPAAGIQEARAPRVGHVPGLMYQRAGRERERPPGPRPQRPRRRCGPPFPPSGNARRARSFERVRGSSHDPRSTIRAQRMEIAGHDLRREPADDRACAHHAHGVEMGGASRLSASSCRARWPPEHPTWRGAPPAHGRSRGGGRVAAEAESRRRPSRGGARDSRPATRDTYRLATPIARRSGPRRSSASSPGAPRPATGATGLTRAPARRRRRAR
jgi:hypothetical protein